VRFMGGKPTEGAPGPSVSETQVLESSSPARRTRPACFRCDDTGYVETRTFFPASKYQPAGTLIGSVRCPHCDAATRSDGAP
jgi:hypothetical protein